MHASTVSARRIIGRATGNKCDQVYHKNLAGGVGWGWGGVRLTCEGLEGRQVVPVQHVHMASKHKALAETAAQGVSC